jgi:ribonuclease BN (tRNA processing enzyme)
MRLVTVGTGTAAPHRARVQAGHLVTTSDALVLLDCGSGVAFRLAEQGHDWAGITHVALTHFHADHIVDLPTLLVAWRYGMLPARTAPLEIIGPVGTAALLERLCDAAGVKYRELGFPVTVRELEPGGRASLGSSTHIACRPVPHTPESVAYLIEGDGRRLVYTGDTGFDEGLGHWAAGCDVFLAECSLPASMAMATHLIPEQTGMLAALAQPSLLVLTHLYPPVEQVDIPAAVAAHYPGAMVVAFDGWSRDL